VPEDAVQLMDLLAPHFAGDCEQRAGFSRRRWDSASHHVVKAILGPSCDDGAAGDVDVVEEMSLCAGEQDVGPTHVKKTADGSNRGGDTRS
jgi:hypothetical protein